MLKSVVFKANDIRGIVLGKDPEWDVAGARQLGSAFVELLELSGKRFVLGYDMRESGIELSEAFAESAISAGADIVEIGLSSTDELWFASGHLAIPAVQFTASHNPAEYNGVKFCLANAQPVAADFTQKLAQAANNPLKIAKTPGKREEWDALSAYAKYLRNLVDPKLKTKLKIVVDAGNGMAGHTANAVFDGLNLDIFGLYMTPDGTFPNHPPNPLVPENLIDAQRAVIAEEADLGLVFDGDADRCFIIDERGAVIDPSAVTALIAKEELAKEPGGTIVINSITSRSVAEVVAENGGNTVLSSVGHTYVKAKMRDYNAIFGGEHSAHYYFRDFWGADTGMLAALHVINMRGQSDRPLSQLVSDFQRYARSGECNNLVTDPKAVIELVKDYFSDRGDINLNDGLTVTNNAEDWWFNLRPSNTEPLLRLNVEARSESRMIEIRDEVLSLVQKHQKNI